MFKHLLAGVSLVCLAFVTVVDVGAQVTGAAGKGWKIGIAMEANLEGGVPTGVKIIDVFRGSPGEKIGLRAGDILHAVDGKLFDDPKAVREDVMGRDRKTIDLVYQRGADFLKQPVEILFVEREVITKVPVLTGKEDGGFVERVTKVREYKGMKPVGAPKKVTDPRTKKPVKENSGAVKVPNPRQP